MDELRLLLFPTARICTTQHNGLAPAGSVRIPTACSPYRKDENYD
jgi:hypothetical protein